MNYANILVRVYVNQPQDEYSIMNSKHFIGIHGFMLVYSVAEKETFAMVQVIHDKILNHLVCSRSMVEGSTSFIVVIGY